MGGERQEPEVLEALEGSPEFTLEAQPPGQLQQRTVSLRSSPFPEPDEVARYEQILPGFTERILALTERESDHRIDQETVRTDATISLAKRGQLLAFVVVMTIVGVSAAAVLTGHSLVGFAGILVAAGAIISAFVAPRIFQSTKALPASPETPELPPADDAK